MGFSLRLLLLWSTGSRGAGFGSSSPWAQKLWHTGSVALRHVGFPGPEIRPVSPASAGGFLTAGPPGSLGPLSLKDHFTLSSLSSDLKTFSFLFLTDDFVSHLNENIQGITREFQHPLTHIYQSVAPVNFLCYKRNLFLCSYTLLLTPDIFPQQAILQFSADSNCCPTI